MTKKPTETIAEYEISSIIDPRTFAGKPGRENLEQTCLSQKGDWFLSHGLGVTDVRPDDLGERLLGSLKDENTIIRG